ncbi:SH3 domain-containing protein [Streptomyces sp. NPDC001663]|uniref:SH3 domain-containing protein n=1 Tax=Streptomyces sp. NPDC001663 TaxID=3364597 RepID=UPI0036BC82E9
MSLRSLLGRVAIAGAAGALLSSVVAAPALADDGDDGGDPGVSVQDGWDQGGDGDPGGNGGQGGDGDWGQGGNNNSRLARGVVTANTLNLRSAPNRGSQVIRVVHRGQRVSIFCQTPGQSVQGNNVWYLLTDGTWAWGSARYIDTIGTPPRWC